MKPEKLVPVIRKLAELTSDLTIEIPRITIQPELKETSSYRRFQLNLKDYTPPPVSPHLST